MNFIVVGTNHKYSPIELRERISFSRKRIKDALRLLQERGILQAAVILSTCNRVEIYAGTKYLQQAQEEIIYFISRYHEIGRQRISPYLYIYREKEAARHLFRVAAGLDSQIPGEVQVLGQIKFSLEEARSINFTNEALINIFNSGICLAKQIHKNTKISQGKVSIGSVAIDFIKERSGTLVNKNILIIGTGKVSWLVLNYLKKEKPNVVFISNRTYEKAEKMAILLGARVVRFDNLRRHLHKADIVISATSSPHFIIRKDTLRDVKNKLLIIDLALPRDIDPQVKAFKNVSLHSLEDLDGVIDKNIENKLKEAEKAEGIVNKEVDRLWENIIEPEPEPALLP